MLINQGVSGPEKATQTKSLCLEGSKAAESYLRIPSLGENGKPATLYGNIHQQKCSKQKFSVSITGL